MMQQSISLEKKLLSVSMSEMVADSNCHIENSCSKEECYSVDPVTEKMDANPENSSLKWM